MIWASETVAEEITKAHATQQAKKARKSGGRWYNGYGSFPYTVVDWIEPLSSVLMTRLFDPDTK